ncbi:MmoB/DmpM family protein [Thermoflavimicrobium dichotomicum]|uniref:Toluene monooxygenase system protein D n=1 Tax=Thermoflavimicrobium dichotomicum TaxID=46223 RepID=A0A1I3N022_9BACL|nr:MmoB/DmpM family protein [Thermoflavimicrobium dichotomicum]SFJ02246.1 toluene monooxygenase system protein D [Thermoflavimicrobium dichotomicum]
MDKEEVKLVGPIVRDPDMADALIAVIEEDNPGTEVIIDDRGGYVRIHTPWRCRITRRTLEEVLGRSITLSQIEPELVSFAGRMRYVGDDEIIFFLERED